ncbi:MAG: A/G-specific adenine glycosylase [Muribaculaceae bacterium]|nr:A/G-specific adenine glycosylase [Muribaculaceae bacterium]
MTHPFAATLLQWYDQYGRDLPWRATRDPYAIWLSEVILQQTRIEQGLPYWERFMQQFPTVEALSAASEDEVLRLWQGLGYYSRARNLHTAAKQVEQLGQFPSSLDGIKSLKGVGDYTAAAIASMAFDIPVAVVDGNVYRVLARHYGIDTPINTTEGKHTFTALAQELLPPEHAAAFNQAMMDFGATWCTPKSPRCSECPLADTCQALHDDSIDKLPAKLKKLKVKTRHFQYIYISCNRFTAMRRRPAGDIWQGLWEPLLIEDTALPQFDGTLTKLRTDVKHVLTHRIIIADFYRLDCDTRPHLPAEYLWIAENDIDRYAIPRLVEILLQSIKHN